MIKRLQLFLGKPDVPLADFLTPLTLDECIERLYGTRVAALDTIIDLKIEPIDTSSYQYHLRMRQHRGRRKIDAAIVGTLKYQSTQITHVLVMREYANADLIRWKEVIALLSVILFVVLLVAKVYLLPLLIIVVMWQMDDDHREVARLIKGALIPHASAEKINPDSL